MIKDFKQDFIQMKEVVKINHTHDALKDFAAKVCQGVKDENQKDLEQLKASIQLENASYQTLQKRYSERIAMALEAKVENLTYNLKATNDNFTTE